MSRPLPRAFLLILAIATILGCGSSENFKLLRDGSIQEVTAGELAEGVKSGAYSETTPIFVNDAWIVIKDHKPAAKIVAAYRPAQPSNAPTTPLSASAPSAGSAVPPVVVINEAAPGEPIDITVYAVPGRTTIFDFYSEYCPPCVAIAPRLAQLAKDDPTFVIRKVDINRPGQQGIDWESPVAAQYGLQSIPHFIIVDGSGAQIAAGAEASQQIREWLENPPAPAGAAPRLPANVRTGSDRAAGNVAYGLGIIILFFVVILGIYAYMAFCLMVIAEKTGTPNAVWAWVPVLNLILMMHIIGVSGWMSILMLIPCVNILFAAFVWCAICDKRGKMAWLGVLILVPGINLLLPAYLAFSE